MNIEDKKYAELIIALSTDFLLNKISTDHYAEILEITNSKFQNLIKERSGKIVYESNNDAE